MKRVATALAVAAVASGATWTGDARATEREHHLGVDIGAAALKVGDKSSLSICCGLGAHYQYGLTDAFNLMVAADFSVVSFGETLDKDTPHTRPTTASHAGVGIGYVFDILTYVPYAGVMIGPTVIGGGTLDHTLVLPSIDVALGLDYKLSHSWSVGFQIRQQMELLKTSDYPSYTNVFLRGEYVWGF